MAKAAEKQKEKTVVYTTRREAIAASRVPGEKPDPTPIAVPIDSQQPQSLREEMMRFIRAELKKQTAEESESFEEADDLNIDDEEPELVTQYTVDVQGLQEEEPTHYDPEIDPQPENASEALTDAPESTTPQQSEALAPPQGAGGVVEPTTETP